MTANGLAATQGTVSWTGGTGNPTSGSLEVDVTRIGTIYPGAWLEYLAPLGDLSGRTVVAWVWLDSGPSPRFKFFAQTGLHFAWADNGPVPLVPRTWTCVSLPISAPSYIGPNYDPTSVVVLGFEMLGSAPFRLYVDTVKYY
jgi:hypothetical protein